MRKHWLVGVLLGGLVSVGHAVELLPAPDIEAVLQQDARLSGPQPYRYAVGIPVTFDAQSSGQWTTTEAGQAIWSLALRAPAATSLSLQLADVQLPDGASLTLDNPQTGASRGPFTAADLIAGQLWTPILRGDELRVVLRTPADKRAESRLRISQANYGFRGFGADGPSLKSGACNVDVVCPEGDEWRREIRSVARYTIQGLFLCTGQLMNNTAGDFRPYFLTASHCLSTEVEANGSVFYFNYETSVCGGTPDGQLEQVVSGASLMATSGAQGPDIGPDFSLLELSEAPPAEFRPYYSGWDNRPDAPESVVAIHHPAGDEKRISFEFDPAEISYYGEEPSSPLSSLLPTHLKINDWDIGTTEGGSSGSGIWNAEHRLVGQLSGGSAACGNDSPDWYGRFHQNWFWLPTENTSLASYLDPTGSGVEFLDGAEPFPVAEAENAAPATRAATTAPASAGGALHWGQLVLLLMLFATRRRA